MSTATLRSTPKTLNGLDPAVLTQLIESAGANPHDAQVRFSVATQWRGGAKSETRVDGCQIGERHVPREFSIGSDEPRELAGEDTQPNPQELLMAAFNSCMLVGYVAGATLHGIELESLSIQTEGQLDLRGFLGLDSSVKPGYDELRYTVRIKGNGSPEQFRQIHETVMATSPNRWNLSQPVKLSAKLVVD